MERRYFGLAAFFVAWLVVLIVPETRHVFQHQIRGFGGFSQQAQALPLVTKELVPQPPSFAQLAPRYANNVGVQLMTAEEQQLATGEYSSYSRSAAKAYDATIRKFPDVAWLLASRLRLTLSWLALSNRTAGELDAEKLRLPNGQTRFTFRKPLPNNWTQADLNAAIEVARRGQKLEPDNGYFDVMLSYLLLADNRDAEALRVLATLKNKPRYDEHIWEDNAAHIAAKRLRYPNLFEDDIAQAAGTLFPHFAPFREMARVLTWKGIQRERAGDHAGALQLYDDVSTLGARMSGGSTTFIGFLVGKAIQQIAWKGGHVWTQEENQLARKSGISPNGSAASQTRGKMSAQRFATYARAHGRSDLAEQALKNNRNNEAVQSKIGQMLAGESVLGLSTAIIRKVSVTFWLTSVLLAQIQWMLIAWAAATLLLLASRVVRRKRAADSSIVRALDVGGAMAWITGLIAILLIAVGIAYTDPFGYQAASGTAASSLVIAVAPLFLGAIYCLFATAWRTFKAARARRASTRAGETPEAEVAAAPSSNRASSWQRDIGNIVVPVLNVAAPAALVLSWILSAVLTADAPGTMNDAGSGASAYFLSGDYSVAIIVTLLVIFWWLVRPSRSSTQSSSRDSVDYAVRWYRQTMLAMIVLASIAYAALALYSLPARAEATRHTNDYIQHGEMALLRSTTTPASTRKQ